MQACRGVCLVVAVSCAGCFGIPADVERVDARLPQRGIRYVLRSPTFKPGLRFKGGDCAGTVTYELVLQQAMDGEPSVYEVRPSPNLLADTNLVLELDSDGGLSLLNAGETDKTAEFITALAAVAVSAAALPLAVPDSINELDNYCQEQRGLEANHQAIQSMIKERRQSLAQPGDFDRSKLVGEISILETELKQVDEDLRKVFPLTPRQCRITIDGRTVYGDSQVAPTLVSIELTRE